MKYTGHSDGLKGCGGEMLDLFRAIFVLVALLLAPLLACGIGIKFIQWIWNL